jgi:tetratricopeptide (TPR) repeat protein
MKLIKFLFLLLFFIVNQYFISTAQNLKKAIETAQIQALIDSFQIRSQIEFSFNQNTSDLSDKKILTAKEIPAQRKKLETKLKNKPSGNDYIELSDFLSEYAPQDSARGKELQQLAKKAYQQQIEQNPQDGESHFQLGNLLHSLGERQNAQAYFEKARELMPDSAKVWSRWGYFAIDYRNIEVAQYSFEKALELDVKNLDAHLGYIMTSIYKSMSLVSVGPVNPIYLSADMSRVELLNQKYPNVLAYETIWHASQLLEMFYRTMIGLAQAADSVDVSADLQSALKYIQTDENKLKKIETFIESALKKRQNNQSMLYDALGVIRFLNRQPDKSIALFEKSLQIDSKRLSTYYNIAFLQALDRKNTEAIATIERKMKILATASDYEIVAYLYARMFKWQESLAKYELGIRKYPDFPNLKIGKSVALAHLKKLSESKAQLIEGLNLNPNHAEGQHFYGLLLLLENNSNKAYYVLSNAKSLGSEGASKLLSEYFE